MRYIQDPKTHKLIPAEDYYQRGEFHAVHARFDAFVSPVDGTLIDSRKKLREHNVKHGVVSQAELGNEGEAARREREKFYTAGGYDNDRRRDAIVFATDLDAAQRSKADKKQMIENYQRLNQPREW